MKDSNNLITVGAEQSDEKAIAVSTDDDFEAPVRLVGRNCNASVSSLFEAAVFMQEYRSSRRPLAQESVIRRLEQARTPEQRREAKIVFRGWAAFEGLLIDSKIASSVLSRIGVD
jgi:hypothetical protein